VVIRDDGDERCGSRDQDKMDYVEKGMPRVLILTG